jgi:zinc protease
MFDFQFERVTLDNGLRVLFHPSNRLPLLSLSAFLVVGKDRNPEGKSGLASMTARLLDEGTTAYSHREISELVETVGGELGSFSERELTGVCLDLHPRDLRLGMSLLAEMIQRPTFPEDRIEVERETVLNHIQSMNDDPHVVGSQRLNRWIYRGTPLAEPVLGDAKSIGGLTRSDFVAFHRACYGPVDTILVAAGDISSGEFHDLARRYFGGWVNPDFLPRPAIALRRQTEPVVDRCRMEKEQVSIYVGHLGIPRDHPDFFAAQVMDAVLGGGPGFTSRIPRRIRDEKGLAYATYSDLAGSAGIHPGRFVAFVGTALENHRQALKALTREIRTFVKEGPSDEEIHTAQEFLTGNFVFEFQSLSSVARLLLSLEIYSLDTDYHRSYRDRIRAVGRREVERVARLCVDAVNYTTVVVGPV